MCSTHCINTHTHVVVCHICDFSVYVGNEKVSESRPFLLSRRMTLTQTHKSLAQVGRARRDIGKALLYLRDVNSAVALTLISRPLSWTEIFIRPVLKKTAGRRFLCFLFPVLPGQASPNPPPPSLCSQQCQEIFSLRQKRSPTGPPFPSFKNGPSIFFFSCFFWGEIHLPFPRSQISAPQARPPDSIFLGGEGKGMRDE